MAKGFMKNGIILFMILSLFLILIGKAYFSQSANLFLYIYGLSTTLIIIVTLLIGRLLYKDPFESIPLAKLKKLRKPFISCILAVKNEEKAIIGCVYSLINSSYKNKEIIIVNDASTDNTKRVLEKNFGKNKQVKIIHLDTNVGKKKAIAQGIKISKGEIFVFTDSDSIVANNAIERIIAVFMNDKSVGAVSGHGRALNASRNIITKVQDTWYETQFSVEKAMESVYGEVTCVSGPLAVFRREAVYNFIPAWENDSFLGKEFKFATDRQMTGYVLGSRYIGKKLKEKYADSPFVQNIDYPLRDWKVLYCKSAKVWTIVPDNFKSIIRQHIRWKKSFIRNLFFTGTFYWRKPIIPALKYYVGALFTIFGPIVAFRHLVYLPYNGNPLSAVFYVSGILFVGMLYGIIFRLEDSKADYWYYRPLMSLFSTLVLSWLIFYSALTIKKSVWHRG